MKEHTGGRGVREFVVGRWWRRVLESMLHAKGNAWRYSKKVPSYSLKH